MRRRQAFLVLSLLSSGHADDQVDRLTAEAFGHSQAGRQGAALAIFERLLELQPFAAAPRAAESGERRGERCGVPVGREECGGRRCEAKRGSRVGDDPSAV